jgi:Family of unknown function (DUF6510)
MHDSDLRLDGNAAAGLFGELFAVDLTAARCCCGGCGAAEQLGAESVHANAPGTVLRCVHCGHVLAVVVHGKGRYWLGVSGMSWLEIPDPEAVVA